MGKYRIERKIAEGGFAIVYQAMDTIEGIRVALKVPYPHMITRESLEDFRREARLAAKLDHHNILPLKNATFIDERFVIVFSLGDQTLDDRLQRRMSFRTAIDFSEQILDAMAYAHHHRIMHCDIKPENMILFPGNRLRLTDFGIARVAMKTIDASGSGTLGYIAPEQAMGKPSLRSDVFSIGLIMYRMFSGILPEWPYEWPMLGYEKIRGGIHPDMIQLMRRALEVDPRKRFEDAVHMRKVFLKTKPRTLRYLETSRRKKNKTVKKRDWQQVRTQQFSRQFGKALETHCHCQRCNGPVSEFMHACPWCRVKRSIHKDKTRFPQQCPRCYRGMKLDWKYCAWCYGAGFEPHSNREYSDFRYQARCSNPRCSRKTLMPFMRYCPWCHCKVRKKWKIADSQHSCPSCNWGVTAFWSYCPWCRRFLGKGLEGRK